MRHAKRPRRPSNRPTNRIPPSDDGTVVKNNVAIYDEETSTFKIIACDEESVTVSSTDGLSEGTVLAVGVTDATPTGALRILGASEPVEGGYRIATSQAALTDAIEYCDVHFTATLTDNGEYEVRDETGRILAVEPAYAGEPLDNLFSKDGVWYKVQTGNEVDARMRIENGHLTFAFTDRFCAGAELDWAKEREKENVSGEKSQDEITLFDKDFRPITFSVGPVPVVITNNVSIDLTASGRAAAEALSAGAVLDKTFGFKFTTGEGFDGINEDASQSPGINISMDGPGLEFQAESEIVAAFSNMLYGVAGIQTSTGIAAEANGELGLANAEDAASEQDVFLLPGTEIPCKGTLDAQISAPITIDLHGELELFGKDGEKGVDLEGNINLVDTEDAITLYELHLSAGKLDDTTKPEKENGPTPATPESNDAKPAKPDGTSASGAQVELTGSYVTKWQDVNMVTYPSFTFSYPENWSITKEDVSQGLERVTLENQSGARIVFSHLPPTPAVSAKRQDATNSSRSPNRPSFPAMSRRATAATSEDSWSLKASAPDRCSQEKKANINPAPTPHRSTLSCLNPGRERKEAFRERPMCNSHSITETRSPSTHRTQEHPPKTPRKSPLSWVLLGWRSEHDVIIAA